MAFPLFGKPKPNFFDNQAGFLAGGLLTVRDPDTNALKATYPTAADADAGTNQLDNPLVLDSRGQAEIWAVDGQEYKYTLTTAGGTTVETVARLDGWEASHPYTPSHTGASSRTIQSRLDDVVSVKDFGAVGDGSTDDSAAIQAAVDAVSANTAIWFPPGSYAIATRILISTANVSLWGNGARIVGDSSGSISSTDGVFTVTAGGFQAHDFYFDMANRSTCIRVEPSSSVANFRFSGLRWEDQLYGIRLDGQSGVLITDVEITDCKGVGPTGQDHGHVFGDYCQYVTLKGCNFRYARTSASIEFANVSHITIADNTCRDNDNASTSDADILVDNSTSAFATIVGNDCTHDIWVSDATDVTVAPNNARRLRVTVSDGATDTYLNASGGTYGRIEIGSFGTPTANRIHGSFTGITLDPVHYTDTTGLSATGAYVGDVKFGHLDFISDGSSSNVSIGREASATYRFRSCDFNSGTVTISDSGGTVNIRDCVDYVTENSGTSAIASGTTSIAVTHGLSRTPSLEDIIITGGEDPTNAVGTIWVDTFTSTEFTVNVENDPGASAWDFGWKAIITRDL